MVNKISRKRISEGNRTKSERSKGGQRNEVMQKKGGEDVRGKEEKTRKAEVIGGR